MLNVFKHTRQSNVSSHTRSKSSVATTVTGPVAFKATKTTTIIKVKQTVKHTKGKRSKEEQPNSVLQPTNEARNYFVPCSRSMKDFKPRNKMEELVVKAYHIIKSNCWPKGLLPVCSPVSASLTAHRLYDAWMPKKIRLVIMAESPSPTFPEGVNGTRLVDPTGLLPAEMIEAGHCNVVHQLSYGEIELLPEDVRNLLSPKDRHAIRAGTHQFWKLLCALSGIFDVGEGESDPLFNTSTLKQRLESKGITKRNGTTLKDRIQAKVAVLNAMRRRGILLIDSSVHPLYKGNTTEKTNKTTGNKYHTPENNLSPRIEKMIIRASWDNYTKHLVESYKPDKLMIIAQSVETAIGGAEDIRRVMSASNIEYLGSRRHPSCPKMKSFENFIPELEEYRKLGLECEEAAARSL